MILKSYTYKGNRKITIFLLLFLILVLNACSSTKYIADYQSIVKEVKIDSVSENFSTDAYNYVQKGIRPASGFGFSEGLYNIFNVKNGVYKTSNIKEIGTPPQLLDSALVELSRKQIEKFLKSNGFFNAKVRDSIFIKDKKAKIFFTATQGVEFTIKNYNYEIADTTFKDLYEKNIKPESKIVVGARFDENALTTERDNIYNMGKGSGFFDINKQYIKYEVDSNLNTHTATVKLIIENPEGAQKHPRYTIGNTNIVIAPNANGFVDSVVLNPYRINDVRYTDLSKKFKQSAILRYDFLKKGDTYDVAKETLTYDRLYQLNNFKNVKIEYTKPADSSKNIINPLIQLTPYQRMGNRIEAEIPFNRDIYGFNLSNTYTNNNFLKGAERFDFQISGGVYLRTDASKSFIENIYQRNFSVSASLKIPRLMTPFPIPLIAKNGVPHTTFSSSYIYNLQKDVLVRQTFINSITYDWTETKSKLHSFTPLNFEYRFGELLLSQKNIDSLLAVSSYNYVLLNRKDVTLGIKYAYDLNSDKLNSNRDFIYFRGTLESAGNLMAGIAKLSGQKFDPKNGQYAKIMGLPFNQYIRPEIDIRWYKNLGTESTFVTRFNAGVGYAYGNSVQLPFEKMFFGGGSIGIRAWQARTLGPGNYNRSVIKGDTPAETRAIRSSLIGVDQLGEMILQGNLEYRFLIKNSFAGGKVKGAFFADAGNVWNLSANQLGQQNTVFTMNLRRLASQIALGTGFGIRYDVQYFVFRLDVGLKIKDPQFSGNDQWVIKNMFSNSKAFKAQYKDEHDPDEYRFFQYNFGIGLPF